MTKLQTVSWPLTLWFAAACHTPPAAPTRLVLTGRGIVTGLDQTGEATGAERDAIVDHLRKLGLQLRPEDVAAGSVAMVRVTCEVPPDAAAGARCDVRCEAEAQGVSLRGGALLRTELCDATGRLRAIAQGSVVVATPAAPGGETRMTAPNTGAGLLLGGGLVVQ